MVNMNLYQYLPLIQTFITVVEEGSFTRAAKKLHVSKVAVSKQIRKLEDRAAAELLDRDNRKLKLTEFGQVFYQQCLEIHREVEAANAILTENKAEPHGKLVVATTEYFAKSVIVNSLKSFMETYPHLELDLQVINRFPDLRREGIDLFWGMNYPGGEDTVKRKLGEATYLTVAAPKYLEKHFVPKIPQDLIKLDFINIGGRSPQIQFSFAKNKKQEFEVPIQPKMVINNPEIVIDLVKEGAGIARLTDFYAGDALAKGELVEILEAYKLPPSPIYYYYPYNRHLKAPVRAFIDFFIEPTKALLDKST